MLLESGKRWRLQRPLLPAEPAFLSRDANTNNNTKLELGVSFSSGLPGWFLSCFFAGFIKDIRIPVFQSQWFLHSVKLIFTELLQRRDLYDIFA